MGQQNTCMTLHAIGVHSPCISCTLATIMYRSNQHTDTCNCEMHALLSLNVQINKRCKYLLQLAAETLVSSLKDIVDELISNLGISNLQCSLPMQ